MSLDSIIEVTIDRQTKSVSKAGFGTILIAGPNATFSGRVQYYTTLASLALDLTGGTSDPEYKMASAIFSQSPRPSRIAIGRIDGGDANLTASLNAMVLEQSDFYQVVITSNQEADQKLLADWVLANKRLAMIRSDDVDIINETDANDRLNKCVIAFDADLITGNNVDLKVNTVAMATVPFNTDHDTTMDDIVTALDAMSNVDGELYGDTANRKIRITRTDGATIAISDALVTGGASQANITTKYASIAAELKAEANDRAAVHYHPDAASDEYPDASAAAGYAVSWGQVGPGAYTGAFKTLPGVSVTDLTPNQSTNALAKNANTYEEIGEVNIIRWGTVAEGEYVDVMIFADWVVARIQETLYSNRVNTGKIPYTEDGLASEKSGISSVLDTGISNGGISPHNFDPTTKERIGGYEVSVPALADISSQDKADRLLDNVTFTAWLAGAIHKIKITGTLTY